MFRSSNSIRIHKSNRNNKKIIIFDIGFRNEIFNITTNYIRKNLVVLEIITTIKKLDKEILVYNILRNNLERRHLRLTH